MGRWAESFFSSHHWLDLVLLTDIDGEYACGTYFRVWMIELECFQSEISWKEENVETWLKNKMKRIVFIEKRKKREKRIIHKPAQH